MSGCLVTCFVLASSVVSGFQPISVGALGFLGFYALFRWGNRRLGLMPTKPNTRREPLVSLFFVCIATWILGIQGTLFGHPVLAAASLAATLALLTLLGLRAWSMNLAAYKGRLPVQFQYDAEREARWINFGRPPGPARRNDKV